MSTVLEKTLPRGAAQRFKERILHTYFVRCYMSFILTVVVAAGLLSSKLMLELGVHSLQLRYPIALLISFGAFLMLIRIWIWRVCPRPTATVDLSGLDPGGFQLSGGGGGSGSGSMSFGGGDSGGAGATSSWEGGEEGTSSGFGSSGGGGGGSGFDLDLGDDWVVILLVVLLALAIVCAGGYLIYAAPQILPEAAWQATLATGLARVSKPTEHENWLRCVVRKSSIPFAVVLILVVVLATVAHRHCPSAVKLTQALHCPVPIPAE